MIRRITVETGGQGLHEITAAVQDAVRVAKVAEGLCTVFMQPGRARVSVGASPPRQPPQRGIAHRHLSR
jgi:thiamine phosphate synthase YjbQ (UPF0047 family)